MDKITVVCHKDHDKGYEDYVGKCLLCEVELPTSNDPISKEDFVKWVKQFGRYPADSKWQLNTGEFIQWNSKLDPAYLYRDWETDRKSGV